MHAAIENAAKNVSINSISDQKNTFKQARRKQIKHINTDDGQRKKYLIENYKVKEFKYKDMKNLTKLADNLLKPKHLDDNNDQVRWLKIKRMKYVKGEKYKIFFNYDLTDDFLIMGIQSILRKQENEHALIHLLWPVMSTRWILIHCTTITCQ